MICGLNVENFKRRKTYLKSGMEYSLQQVNNDYTLDLEERVISLKARIRERKKKIGDYDHQGRIEPKLDFTRSPAP